MNFYFDNRMSELLEEQTLHVWKSSNKKYIIQCMRCGAKYKIPYLQRICFVPIDLPKTGCIMVDSYYIIGDITQYSDYDTMILTEANRTPIN